MEEKPQSKRWIWITASVLAVCGGFFWLYLQDDPPSPDDDLIRERAVFTEEENGYALVIGLGEEIAFKGEDADWMRDFARGRAPWDGPRAERVLAGGAQGTALEILGELKKKRVIAAPTAQSQRSDSIVLHLGGVSFLGNLNMLAMARAAMAGDRVGFLEHLETGLRLAEQIERPRQAMMDVSTGMTLRDDVLQGVLLLAESPLFADAECRARGLAILDNWDGYELWCEGMRDEYRLFRNTLVELKKDGLDALSDFGVRGLAFGTMRLKVNRTSKRAANYVRAITSVKGETWKELYVQLNAGVAAELGEPNPIELSVGPNGTGEFLLSSAMPVFSGVLGRFLRVRSRLEMARALFALRDFQEANGRLPDLLADLVPQFLEAVPSDHMDGNPLRYDPTRAMLWSVGRNLDDDGGDLKSNDDDCLRIPWVKPEGGA